MKNILLYFLALFLFTTIPSTYATDAPAVKKEPRYFVFKKRPVAPRCIWYLSIESTTTKEGDSVDLLSCETQNRIQYEKFGPVEIRPDGTVSQEVEYGDEKDPSKGYIQYKALGDITQDGLELLLVKTTGGWSGHYSVLASFRIKNDRLVFGNIYSKEDRSARGIEDASFENGNIYMSSYMTPYEIGLLAMDLGYLVERPPEGILERDPKTCAGMVYRRGNEVIGLFPSDKCGTVPLNQDNCFTKMMQPYMGRTLAYKELSNFFFKLRDECQLK